MFFKHVFIQRSRTVVLVGASSPLFLQSLEPFFNQVGSLRTCKILKMKRVLRCVFFRKLFGPALWISFSLQKSKAGYGIERMYMDLASFLDSYLKPKTQGRFVKSLQNKMSPKHLRHASKSHVFPKQPQKHPLNKKNKRLFHPSPSRKDPKIRQGR